MQEPKKLEEFEVFQMAQGIGERVWNLVLDWSQFAKNTVGEQYVSAADSISANIAEGYGRFHFRERRTFCYYSRGSLIETKAWTLKSFNRKLIGKEDYEDLMEQLYLMNHKLNGYIISINRQLNSQ